MAAELGFNIVAHNRASRSIRAVKIPSKGVNVKIPSKGVNVKISRKGIRR